MFYVVNVFFCTANVLFTLLRILFTLLRSFLRLLYILIIIIVLIVVIIIIIIIIIRVSFLIGQLRISAVRMQEFHGNRFFEIIIYVDTDIYTRTHKTDQFFAWIYSTFIRMLILFVFGPGP